MIELKKVGKVKPKNQAWWLGKTFECLNCGAHLLMDGPGDVKSHQGRNETLYDFACPECHHVTPISQMDALPAKTIAGPKSNVIRGQK